MWDIHTHVQIIHNFKCKDGFKLKYKKWLIKLSGYNWMPHCMHKFPNIVINKYLRCLQIMRVWSFEHIHRYCHTISILTFQSIRCHPKMSGHLVDGGTKLINGATDHLLKVTFLGATDTAHIHDSWIQCIILVLFSDSCFTLFSNSICHLIQMCSYDNYWWARSSQLQQQINTSDITGWK